MVKINVNSVLKLPLQIKQMREYIREINKNKYLNDKN